MHGPPLFQAVTTYPEQICPLKREAGASADICGFHLPQREICMLLEVKRSGEPAGAPSVVTFDQDGEETEVLP